ncbi:MAG: type II toxin-antitoxin system HicA family toxin [Caldilineaceae bacterium]|nr:type II toxin-antitoxin system HicA family toxin [Caldilineaceae bacterium]
MRIPRDVSGEDLIKRLGELGYVATRQSGSHVRLTNHSLDFEHHVTVPLHSALRVGTLNSILNDIATHLAMDKSDLMRTLFE